MIGSTRSSAIVALAKLRSPSFGRGLAEAGGPEDELEELDDDEGIALDQTKHKRTTVNRIMAKEGDRKGLKEDFGPNRGKRG